MQYCSNMMEMMSGMMGSGMMDGGMMGGGMMLAAIVFLVLVIAAVVFLIGLLRNKTPNTGSHALSILQERFARGEVDQEEYQERRRVLLEQA